MNFLRKKTSTIYLLLGEKCNLHCNYCVQKEDTIIHNKLKQCDNTETVINKDIYKFIEDCYNENINLNNNDYIRFVFFGGEPLLYWEQIKEVVDNLKHLDLMYQIITNGKTLTQDKVDYFNEHNFYVMISYDGPESLKNRNYDVLQEHAKLISKIRNLRFISVLTKYNSLISILDSLTVFYYNYYNKIHKHCFNIEINPVVNNAFDYKEIYDIDLNKLYNEMKYIVDLHFKQKNKLTPYKEFINSLLKTIYFRVNNHTEFINNMKLGGCHAGDGSLFNLDLQGNLYLCHHRINKCGTIYSDLADYVKNCLLNKDNLHINFEKCETCPAQVFCNGGCVLTNGELSEQYCINYQTFYMPLIDAILQHNGGE